MMEWVGLWGLDPDCSVRLLTLRSFPLGGLYFSAVDGFKPFGSSYGWWKRAARPLNFVLAKAPFDEVSVSR